jgi:hypothetical protein
MADFLGWIWDAFLRGLPSGEIAFAAAFNVLWWLGFTWCLSKLPPPIRLEFKCSNWVWIVSLLFWCFVDGAHYVR